jgi:hypothetical protein
MILICAISQGYIIGNDELQSGSNWYFWELVVVSRKIAIIIISVCFLIFACIGISFVFVRILNPIVYGFVLNIFH